MNKRCIFLAVLLVLGLATLAAALPAGRQEATPADVKNYIGQLETKLSQAQAKGAAARVSKIKQMIAEQKQRLEEMKTEEDQTAEDKLAGMQADTNKALADLKGQIDSVKSANSDAKVGAQIFFRWQKYTAGNSTNANNFDVDRAYLDFKKNLDWNASARLTLDVARITGAARQNLFDYLKYAYVEMPLNVSGLQLIPFSLTAKIGLQHTIWIDWADKQLGLRYITKSLIDNEGVMSSADFGLGALGKCKIAGLPEIEYMTTVLNGTGYATNESDSNKAVAARLNSTVYSDPNYGNLILALYGNVESLNTSFNLATSNKQAGLGLSYQHETAKAFIEYVTGSKSSKDINGYSLGGVLNLSGLVGWLNRCSLFARVDSYNPDTSATNNVKNKSFYGLTYDWGKDVKLAMDMQNSQTGNGAITSIFYLHSMIQL